jgi:hypothetical protein
MEDDVQVLKQFPQDKAQAARTASWRRRRLHVWRGQSVSTVGMIRLLSIDANDRRREAVCRLMEDNGVPNTRQGHRHAYVTIWTDRIRQRLGRPPQPGTVVKWRRRRMVAAAIEVAADGSERKRTGAVL